MCLCWKQRKGNSSPFVFVRYAYLKEAEQVIRSLHSVTLKDKTILVKLANCRRKNNRMEGKIYIHQQAEGLQESTFQ